MSSSNSSGEVPISILEHYTQIQDHDETVFLVFQVVGGQVLLPVLLIVIRLFKIQRHPVFLNFCFSWILSSIFYSLLVYRGRSTPALLSLEPNMNLCLLQAALINGVQTFTACTTLALVIYMWTLLRTLSFGMKVDDKKMTFQSVLLLVVPFIVFSTFTLVTVILGDQSADDPTGAPISNTNLAVPTVFYCVILQNGNFTSSLAGGLTLFRVVYVFTAFISFVTMIFDAMILMTIVKVRKEISNISRTFVGLFIRIASFSLYRGVSLCLTLAVVVKADEIFLAGIASNPLFNGVIDIFQATLPLVAFLIFGTQADIIDVVCFWRRKKDSTESTPRFDRDRKPSLA